MENRIAYRIGVISGIVTGFIAYSISIYIEYIKIDNFYIKLAIALLIAIMTMGIVLFSFYIEDKMRKLK